MAKRTVRVRVMVATWPDGSYHAYGAGLVGGSWRDQDLRTVLDEDMRACAGEYLLDAATINILSAEVEIPECPKPQEIEAEVEGVARTEA